MSFCAVKLTETRKWTWTSIKKKKIYVMFKSQINRKKEKHKKSIKKYYFEFNRFICCLRPIEKWKTKTFNVQFRKYYKDQMMLTCCKHSLRSHWIETHRNFSFCNFLLILVNNTEAHMGFGEWSNNNTSTRNTTNSQRKKK